MSETQKFSLKGWNLGQFAKGRKRLFVTVIGAFGAFIITNRPQLAILVGAMTEMLFAVAEFYFKE